MFHRKAHVVHIREAAIFSAFWVGLGVSFGVFVVFWLGPTKGIEYFTGYLIEKSLSVDNVFVFALIFGAFAVPAQYQHRVLFWGVVGALAMRFVMIVVGSALIEAYQWILYVFGAFLILTGIRMALSHGKPENGRRRGHAGVVHRRLELRAAGEGLGGLQRGELMRDRDVIRVVGGPVDRFLGHAHCLLGGGEVVEDAAPGGIVGDRVSNEQRDHRLSPGLRIADLDMLEHDGFPLTWFDVLSRLADAGPAGLRMQELEERSLFSRGGLTRLVDRMGAAGLVRREPVPGDRRGVRVVLTTDGRQRHAVAIARHREVIEREFGRRLTPAQHRAVADALWSWWHARGASG